MKDHPITKKANQLLAKARITAPPVPVTAIAKALGVTVHAGPLPDDLSGFLVHQSDSIVIGVNSLHPKPRQAFTVAHEIGHYLLHPTGNFVDRKLLLFRDSRSAQAIDPKEIQANQFAADLLMPEHFLQELLKGEVVDLEDEDRVRELAKVFGVSMQALMFRLMNLNLARQKP